MTKYLRFSKSFFLIDAEQKIQDTKNAAIRKKQVNLYLHILIFRNNKEYLHCTFSSPHIPTLECNSNF